MVDPRYCTATEAVAAIRRDGAAVLDTLRRLRRGAIVGGRIVRTAGGRPDSGVGRVAFEVPVATIVPHPGVSVEEAVLLAGVHIVAWYSGCERRLVIVERADALGILEIDFTVSIVIQSIRALGVAELSASQAAGAARSAAGLAGRSSGPTSSSAARGAGVVIDTAAASTCGWLSGRGRAAKKHEGKKSDRKVGSKCHERTPLVRGNVILCGTNLSGRCPCDQEVTPHSCRDRRRRAETRRTLSLGARTRCVRRWVTFNRQEGYARGLATVATATATCDEHRRGGEWREAGRKEKGRLPGYDDAQTELGHAVSIRSAEWSFSGALMIRISSKSTGAPPPSGGKGRPEAGLECCHASCGTCLKPGGSCTQQACVPPSPPIKCQANADCRAFSDYCTGCDCRALASGDADPVCPGPGVLCIADPCTNRIAVCLDGACNLVTARP